MAEPRCRALDRHRIRADRRLSRRRHGAGSYPPRAFASRRSDRRCVDRLGRRLRGWLGRRFGGRALGTGRGVVGSIAAGPAGATSRRTATVVGRSDGRVVGDGVVGDGRVTSVTVSSVTVVSTVVSSTPDSTTVSVVVSVVAVSELAALARPNPLKVMSPAAPAPIRYFTELRFMGVPLSRVVGLVFLSTSIQLLQPGKVPPTICELPQSPPDSVPAGTPDRAGYPSTRSMNALTSARTSSEFVSLNTS